MATATKNNKQVSRKFEEILPGYLSIKEFAEEVGLSASQIWRYVTDDILPHRDTPIGYAIHESQLETFQPMPKGNPAFRTKRNPAKLASKKARKES